MPTRLSALAVWLLAGLPIMLWAASGPAQYQPRDDAYRSPQSQDHGNSYGSPSGGEAYRGTPNEAYQPGYGGSGPRHDDAYRPPGRGDAYGQPPPGYGQPPPGGYAQGGGYSQPYPPPGQAYSSPGQPYHPPGQQPSYGPGQPYSPPPGQAYSEPAYGTPGPYDRPAYDRPDGPNGYDDGPDNTYSSREILDAGHSFFGTVTQGLAKVVEYAFQQQGRPNGYILGQDAGGAFVAGLRYGEGMLYTKDAGTHRVYWQGPSIGYDAGAEGSKVMVLVYNLRDPEDIYQRFGGVAGSAYIVGGLGLTFQKSGDVVVAPIRAGVGLRLGANVGYLKYTRRPTWNPF